MSKVLGIMSAEVKEQRRLGTHQNIYKVKLKSYLKDQ